MGYIGGVGDEGLTAFRKDFWMELPQKKELAASFVAAAVAVSIAAFGGACFNAGKTIERGRSEEKGSISREKGPELPSSGKRRGVTALARLVSGG